MSDLNRRFSRGQWNKNNGVNGNLPDLPIQNGFNNNNYRNGNINQLDIPNTNYQYNGTSSSLNVNDYNNLATGAESIHSNATNATSATTRRRFSIKLSQPPADLYNSINAPSLPYNAQSQILNSSYTNISETAIDDGYNNNLPPIQQNRDIENNNFMNHNHGNNININNNNSNNHINSPVKSAQDLLNELTVENFDATKFVQIKLGDANAARIDDFSKYIETLNIANDDAVKYSLSESTNQVLAVSDAFKQTHEVLLSLKPKINDLTDLLSQQLEEAQEYKDKLSNNDGDNSNSKLNRQSVMILQNKWSNAMKKLYSNIDRAHDLLPPLQSRHIIIESRRWGELNSITCNPVRPVHIVVLNDSILIASRVRNPSKYLPDNNLDNNSSKKSKNTRNIATHVWMVDSITVQKCSEIKEFNDILSHNNLSFSKNRNQSNPTDAESAADSTLCIRTLDSNQTFLFQTDLTTEFIKVYNAIQQAKAESSSKKRKSMVDSFAKMNLNPHSRHVSLNNGVNIISDSNQNASTQLEKQIEPEFESSVSTIDDLLTSASLELGLKRFDECIGYLSRLDEEIRQLAQMAIALGVPNSLINSKSLTSNKRNGLHFSVFTQNVHLTYNLKSSNLKKITEHLVHQLLEEISSTNASFQSLRECVDIFKILKREKEAAEVYLESRSRELSDCVGLVRVGGCGNNNGSFELSNSINPKSKGFNDKSMSRSNSSKSLTASLNSKSSNVNVTPDPDESIDKDNTNKNMDSVNGVTGELVTAYVRELSLVYMGFLSRIWQEWNDLFIDKKVTDKKLQSNVSNVRMIEWINENIAELVHSVQLALLDYDRNGAVFKSSVQVMKSVFEELKDMELNVDYLLEI